MTVLECFGKLAHECAEYLQPPEIMTVSGIVDALCYTHDSPNVFLLISRLISIVAPEFAEMLRKGEHTNLKESSFDLENYAFRARLFLDRKNLSALFS